MESLHGVIQSANGAAQQAQASWDISGHFSGIKWAFRAD
jgi:hypothetical protein